MSAMMPPGVPPILLFRTFARNMLAYTLVIGNYFIAAQHGDKTRAQVLQLAIDRLLR